MDYISIDTETTGLNPNTCQILQIGAIAFVGGVVKEFEVTIKHDLIHGEPIALQMNMKILDSGVPIQDAWDSWRDFISQFGRFTPAGKNFAFDKSFLIANGFELNCRHRAIDVGNLYLEPNDVVIPNLGTCMQRAGLQGTVSHTALADARIVHNLIQLWMERK